MKKIIALFLSILLIVGLAGGAYWYRRCCATKPPQLPTIERTLAIIKPDAVQAKHAGSIIDIIEKKGFTITALKKIRLADEEARTFYAVHRERPFFADLVSYITSGPVVVMVLEKEGAVQAWRTLMGNTNPAKAEVGTIRQLFGTDIQHNAAHGSDSVENAKIEIDFFFPDNDS